MNIIKINIYKIIVKSRFIFSTLKNTLYKSVEIFAIKCNKKYHICSKTIKDWYAKKYIILKIVDNTAYYIKSRKNCTEN